jgi:hypothetical protein
LTDPRDCAGVVVDEANVKEHRRASRPTGGAAGLLNASRVLRSLPMAIHVTDTVGIEVADVEPTATAPLKSLSCGLLGGADHEVAAHEAPGDNSAGQSPAVDLGEIHENEVSAQDAALAIEAVDNFIEGWQLWTELLTDRDGARG